MRVLGRDIGRGAYRVAVAQGESQVMAWVPEALMQPGSTPSHQAAYEWIATHRGKIEKAILAMKTGRSPKAPYDQIELAEET